MKPICRNSEHWRWLWIACLFLGLAELSLFAQRGLPFIANYSAKTYEAHNRNFDVVCDSAGTTYFANFEGIIYYNGERWGKILTPGISRITRLYIDRYDQLWAGGYNYIGKLGVSPIGTPQLISYLSDAEGAAASPRIGEVNRIVEREDSLCFYTAQYCVTLYKDSLLAIQEDTHSLSTGGTVKQLTLPNHTEIRIQAGGGLVLTDETQAPYVLNEANGLCSNQINALAADGDGTVWGATDQGIFRLSLPSFFSRFTPTEGLKGEVTTILRHMGRLYVGTLHGLFCLDATTRTFQAIPEIRQACWRLQESPSEQFYAATTNGLFRISPRKVEQLSDYTTFSLAFDPDDERIFYTGELDGIYRLQGKTHTKIADVERAMKLEFIQGKLWAETLYGELYQIGEQSGTVLPLDTLHGLPSTSGNKLYNVKGRAEALSTQGLHYWDGMTQRFVSHQTALDSLIAEGVWWPGLLAQGANNSSYWVANGEGKELQILIDGKPDQESTRKLHPLNQYTIRALYVEPEGTAWIGGDFGLIHFDPNQLDLAYLHQPDIHIRQIQLNKEQLYFDGTHTDMASFGLDHAVFPSDTKELTISFSSDANDVIDLPEYSFYLEGYESNWRPWSKEQQKEYTNLSYGTYTFHGKMRDAFGRESAEETFTFTILIPFYLKWYCLLAYLLAFVALIIAFLRYRTHKLWQEKLRLEAVVAERTQEVVAQRDEIAEKSTQLEQTLHELKEAQEQLIRQEKVATVGKLTQGLIDRILNPLNYIINFSHLSHSLLKDMREDVEDEQEQISEDNYEDMQEILDMLNTHLTKIELHGQSTSRILKAMEELLSDQTLHFQMVNINQLIHNNIAMLREYDQKEIAANQIAIEFTPLDSPLEVEVDPVRLGKTIVSILHNGVYALAKKYAQQPFEAKLQIRLEQQADKLLIYLHDNGIGIELNIREKIFDPFFTTKTTAEAAGVGLYLCREVILGHKGQIAVQSAKNEFTQFVLTIPIHQSTK